MFPDMNANGDDLYEEIVASHADEDRRDYNTIMSRAIKAGPLLMKINLMRWRKVTAAVLVSLFMIFGCLFMIFGCLFMIFGCLCAI